MHPAALGGTRTALSGPPGRPESAQICMGPDERLLGEVLCLRLILRKRHGIPIDGREMAMEERLEGVRIPRSAALNQVLVGRLGFDHRLRLKVNPRTRRTGRKVTGGGDLDPAQESWRAGLSVGEGIRPTNRMAPGGPGAILD